jgi:hypothetical protein
VQRAIEALLNWSGGREDREDNQAPEREPTSAMEPVRQPEQHPPSTGGYGLQLQSDDDPSEDYPPDDYDLPELPETDLAIMRDAKHEQARFEASDSYGAGIAGSEFAE